MSLALPYVMKPEPAPCETCGIAGMALRRLAGGLDVGESEFRHMSIPDSVAEVDTIERAMLDSGRSPWLQRGRERPRVLRQFPDAAWPRCCKPWPTAGSPSQIDGPKQEKAQMHKAIHRPRRIAAAQRTLLRRMRKELPTRLRNVTVGFKGDSFELSEVFANNAIWFAHQSLETETIPRNWNALGAGMPALRRSNSITVEVNIALHGVDKRVAGLFALDEETGNTALLHRGRIGGGRRGVGQASFMEWYSGRKVSFIDPSRNDEEATAILVADLGSSEFLGDVESFVQAVHKFKASLDRDDPGQLSDSEIRKRAAAAPPTPRSSTTAVVVYARNPHVAEFAKRRARGKCELCKRPAPFKNASNEPYLESHHIVWLARGGADRPENTVALCPNCHRKMHVVNDAKDLRTLQRRAKAALAG